jgi:hypothetical protein
LRLLRVVPLPAQCFLLFLNFRAPAIAQAQSPSAASMKSHIDAQQLQSDLEKLSSSWADIANGAEVLYRSIVQADAQLDVR